VAWWWLQSERHRHRFPVDPEFEVLRRQALDPFPLPVGDDDLDVHHANVHHVREQFGQRVVLGDGREGGQKGEGRSGDETLDRSSHRRPSGCQ